MGISAVAGITDAIVDVEEASLTAIDKDGRVTRGGSIVDGTIFGGVFKECLLGLLPGECLCFVTTFRD